MEQFSTVAVGSSAGGLIVQHLEPRHKSLNLSTVYIAPPNKHLLASDRKILVRGVDAIGKTL